MRVVLRRGYGWAAVRTLSTIGFAACSTPATEAAILSRLVERLSWSLSPVIVLWNSALAEQSSAEYVAEVGTAAGAGGSGGELSLACRED
jgi:hypothetical protein